MLCINQVNFVLIGMISLGPVSFYPRLARQIHLIIQKSATSHYEPTAYTYIYNICAYRDFIYIGTRSEIKSNKPF